MGCDVRSAAESQALGVIAAFDLICFAIDAADAANFTCSWDDATANWSNCNGTDPNDGGGNSYCATIATGDPTLTTAITIGSVTITSPGAWTLSGSSASAVLTGTLANSGDPELHKNVSLSTGGNLTNSGP